MKCNHDKIYRRQHQDVWECVKCGMLFWGNKDNNVPEKDIYGNNSFDEPKITMEKKQCISG